MTSKYWSSPSVDYPYLYSNISLLHLILLNYSIYISKMVEISLIFLPASVLRIFLLRGFLLGTQGSICSAQMALQRKFCIHVGGGFHHAHSKGGSGFCIYNDIGITAKYLTTFYPQIKTVLVLDLDAHQGNGHERDKALLKDKMVIADMYNPHIFPLDIKAKQYIDFSRHVTRSTSSKEYLLILEELLFDIQR